MGLKKNTRDETARYVLHLLGLPFAGMVEASKLQYAVTGLATAIQRVRDEGSDTIEAPQDFMINQLKLLSEHGLLRCWHIVRVIEAHCEAERARIDAYARATTLFSNELARAQARSA